MSNTQIQIKRSTTTATPTNGSLLAGELAISYQSNKLFAGNSAGTGIDEIGGKLYVDLTNFAAGHANAAFEKANTGLTETGIVNDLANAAYLQANTARNHANAAFEKANAANVLAFNIGISANAYAQEVGTAGNAYTQTVGTAGNTYADTVGTAANNYANATFVKLTNGTQTITGDIAITGNLIITGNTTTVGTQDLVVEDPLILLANNNTTDVVDIGIVAHYANATSEQVHTGIIRDPGTKQWYFFKEYNDHFLYQGGNVDLSGNNFTLDTVNANFVTNNLILGGANAILTIGAAYDKANAANLLAYNTGIGANAYTVDVGAAGNAYTQAVGTAGNAYTVSVGTAGNNYTISVGAAANGWANTISATRAAASNAYAESVGAAANSYAATVGAAANTNAANGSYISTGIVKVSVGGTGVTSFTQNGILFGNTAGDLKVTAAGTEGQVLQATGTGVPQFGMISGGEF
jgi:hypothetical protein